MQIRSRRRWVFSFLLTAVLTGCSAVLTGCSAGSIRNQYDGPKAAAVFHADPWVYGTDPGVAIHTDHYTIYTTIKDESLKKYLAEVMEGGFSQYTKVAPGVPLTPQTSGPMECYVFADRGEWTDFTRRNTGYQAAIYLQINRGGYTVRDRYVAYFCGESATLSIAAHEGWHQFVSRHFKGRLPPFFEEGVATMFEDIEWTDGLPRWNLVVNRSRLQSLRTAVEGNFVYSLQDLIQLHAGNVVALSGAHIEAFYAEDWAFATFLWSADHAKYRPAMRRMMSDIADGTVYDPTGVHADATVPWNPAGVRPMLEHYLGMSLEAINVEYQKYIKKIAFDDYASQWN